MQLFLEYLYFLVSSDSEYIEAESYFNGTEADLFLNGFLINTVFVFVMAVIFYLVINKNSIFNKFIDWIKWLLVILAIAGLVAYLLMRMTPYSPSMDLLEFTDLVVKYIINSIFISALLYFIFSLLLKGWSKNAKYTPF